MKRNRGIRAIRALVVSGGLFALWACESTRPYDYSAFATAKPAAILVLPPINESPESGATPGVWAQSTKPLAEAGYYVMPVTLVEQTFKQNGVHQPVDAHRISHQKLREVFGADAALYLRVKRYGTRYSIVSSTTEVALQARLVDLRSGKQLWDGEAFATSADPDSDKRDGLTTVLAKALIGQILETATDESFNQAASAANALFRTDVDGGILPGPRSGR